MLTVLTGPPGAGKSTLADVLVGRLERGVLVPGDRFLGFIRSGFVAPWVPGAEAQNATAWDASMRAASAYLEGGFDVVYDGIVHPGSLEEVVAHARGAPVSYVVLLPPLAVCLERVRTRIGHGFRDEDVTRQLHESFATSTGVWRHVVAGVRDVGSLADEVGAGGFLVDGVAAAAAGTRREPLPGSGPDRGSPPRGLRSP